MSFPSSIPSVAVLEEMLSRPTDPVVEFASRLKGDVLVLGAAGKIGPSLCTMLARASRQAGVRRTIYAASRFSNPLVKSQLEHEGIQTIACDLLSPPDLLALPETPHILFLAGMKFGATGNEPLTWAMNSLLPAQVCQRFPRSRITAFSTGTVYGWVPTHSGGASENSPLNPVGEYAMSCLGRERMFEFHTQRNQSPTTLLRLFYACEPRYGVLLDIGLRVFQNQPVDVSMGCFNAIWQGDANALSLLSMDHASVPPKVFNLTGPSTLVTREVAHQFGQAFNKAPRFIGQEAPTACLGNVDRATRTLGSPIISTATLISWTAEWIKHSGPTLGKPTRFESRDGRY